MKKGMAILFLVLAASFSGVAYAEQLVSSKGDANIPVIVFKTEDSMVQGFQYLISGGSDSDPKFLSYAVGTLPSGTRCTVIEATSLGKKVRILSGPYKGKVGWVPAKMVR
jgi:hypothetical protein